MLTEKTCSLFIKLCLLNVVYWIFHLKKDISYTFFTYPGSSMQTFHSSNFLHPLPKLPRLLFTLYSGG